MAASVVEANRSVGGTVAGLATLRNTDSRRCEENRRGGQKHMMLPAGGVQATIWCCDMIPLMILQPADGATSNVVPIMSLALVQGYVLAFI